MGTVSRNRGVRRRLLLVLVVAGAVCAGAGGALLLRGALTGEAAPAPQYSVTAGGDRYSPADPARLLSSPGAGVVLLVAGAGAAVAGTALLRRRARRDATRS